MATLYSGSGDCNIATHSQGGGGRGGGVYELTTFNLQV